MVNANIEPASNFSLTQDLQEQTEGTTSYLDLGLMQAQLWSFMVWWPDVMLNMDQFDQYLDSLYDQLQDAGVTNLDLSFGQLGSIDSLLNQGEGAPSDDVLSLLLRDFPDALQEIVDEAHSKGMTVGISMGGALGTSMKIVGDGETAEGQAQKLLQFMDQYNIDSVDFDIESSSFSYLNSADDARTFFETVHNRLSQEGKSSTLTVMGDFNQWANNYLKDLFYDDNGNTIFFDLFDGLNLMLYSDVQYYLDANDPSWGVEQWLDIIGPENADKLHIGFEDNIDYANPGSSAGGRYNIDTTDSGKAAAEIYKQLEQNLANDGYTNPMGQPFFWPDTNRNAGNEGGKGRYAPTFGDDGSVTVNFDTGFMQSFQAEMQA